MYLLVEKIFCAIKYFIFNENFVYFLYKIYIYHACTQRATDVFLNDKKGPLVLFCHGT